MESAVEAGSAEVAHCDFARKERNSGSHEEAGQRRSFFPSAWPAFCSATYKEESQPLDLK